MVTKTKLLKTFYILSLTLALISCSKDGDQPDGSNGSSSIPSIVEKPIEEVPSEDPIIELFEKVYEQTFESFDLKGSWMLSDFGLQGESDKDLYTEDESLFFDLQWTKRTRNHLADKLGYERSEMTHEFTNSLCAPKIEIGKESVYTNSLSSNLVAELDTDLTHCGISGTEPAAINMRSFIPTKVGYKYKVKVKYMMRSYNGQTEKSYRDLVVRFGKELEKFDPVYDSFQEAELTVLATRSYSKLMISDNGLPDSFGILVDNVLISEGQKVERYDDCAQIFPIESGSFRKCIQGEIETDQICDLSNLNNAIIKTSKAQTVASNRRQEENIFNVSAAKNGTINFFSLGLKGKVKISCAIDGHKAYYPIEGKTVSMREISWNNSTPSSYPEIAKVRVRLSGCNDETLNRTTTIGTVKTNESFSYSFGNNSEEKNYSGCNMENLIIKDITPNGPSMDGFDLNSLKFSENS